MQWIQRLKSSPAAEVARWSDMRAPWLLIAALCCVLLFIAHGVFQVWLYMKPCEQCVYIRFAFLVIALGALAVCIAPKSIWVKLAGSAACLYGCVYGAMCAVRLSRIHHAVHSDSLEDLFGMQGCSSEPHYPFGLPLEKWAPDWFLPTGDCGYDLAVVPDGVQLSAIQQWLINLYNSSDSWYLIPSLKFMNMAECCLLAFAVASVMVIALAGASVWTRAGRRRRAAL